MKTPHLKAVVVGLIFIAAGLMLLRDLRPPRFDSGMELGLLAQIPIQEGGRIKPMDTLARTSLMLIGGKQTYRDIDGRRLPAIEWFAELILHPQMAARRPVFRIDHPDLVGLLGFHNEQRKFFSLAEIAPHFDSLQEQFADIPSEPQLQSPLQKALRKLQISLGTYDRLSYLVLPPMFLGDAETTLLTLQRIHADRTTAPEGSEMRDTIENAVTLFAQQFSQIAATAHVQPIPPSPDDINREWTTLGDNLLRTLETGTVDPVLQTYVRLAKAFQNKDQREFNAAVASLSQQYAERAGADANRTGFEYFFNYFAPFYYAMEIYVLVFLVAALSWLGWGRTLAKTAFWLMVLAFAVHTFGMVARIYIQARPPVTNLYSSAIFVSWAAVPLCLYLERRHLNGIPSAAAAIMGFTTLIIAHHLSFSGDTLEVMRAVLDSNFWLATHVPTVTIGYSAAFLAGFIAIVYILRRALKGDFTPEAEKSISGMVYGTVCFALLFSYVGTVLGGIWADQSWGRFWGWDPKENGALMIVLWNAVILHARWAKIASTMGIMQLAIFGNIITAWSDRKSVV